MQVCFLTLLVATMVTNSEATTRNLRSEYWRGLKSDKDEPGTNEQTVGSGQTKEERPGKEERAIGSGKSKSVSEVSEEEGSKLFDREGPGSEQDHEDEDGQAEKPKKEKEEKKAKDKKDDEEERKTKDRKDDEEEKETKDEKNMKSSKGDKKEDKDKKDKDPKGPKGKNTGIDDDNKEIEDEETEEPEDPDNETPILDLLPDWLRPCKLLENQFEGRIGCGFELVAPFLVTREIAFSLDFNEAICDPLGQNICAFPSFFGGVDIDDLLMYTGFGFYDISLGERDIPSLEFELDVGIPQDGEDTRALAEEEETELKFHEDAFTPSALRMPRFGGCGVAVGGISCNACEFCTGGGLNFDCTNIIPFLTTGNDCESMAYVTSLAGTGETIKPTIPNFLINLHERLNAKHWWETTP